MPELTTEFILGGIGVIMLCVLFGAIGLMEAYKGDDDDDKI